jgi:signal transduction histidine kinase
MVSMQEKPERLELPYHRNHVWPYLLLGALLGAVFEMLINVPLDAVFRSIFAHIFAGNAISLTHALAHLARPGEWPAVSLTGFIFGAALGLAFYRLKENQKRLLSLRQEFEIQVSSVRHHYKNLALGISGFSSRAKRKLEKVQQQIGECISAHGDIRAEMEALERSITVLEDASQRLTSTLKEELMFLKAMQSDSMSLAPRDFFLVLRRAVRELLDLRFREKTIIVEINDQPLSEPCAPLYFSFDPVTMEIILQNILSNAMRHADVIQVKTAAHNSTVAVEIRDNGPGINVQEIKRRLVSASERRGTESTELGLRISLHLLERYGGRLYAANNPDGGAAFILEFPK